MARRLFHAVVLVGTSMGAAGCASRDAPPSTDARTDAVENDGTTDTFEMPMEDTGSTPVVDTGSMPVDTGAPPVDSGKPPLDSAAMPDTTEAGD